jgi:hypothetical protein
MTDPQPPTEGSRRCMIYRHVRRLEDGCDGCSKSAMFCAANADMNQARCCPSCSHS